MDVRVITLRYQEGLQGFPEEAFCRAYGAETLGLMPDVTAPAPEGAGEGGGADAPEAGAETAKGGRPAPGAEADAGKAAPF